MKKDNETIKRRSWLGGVATVGAVVAGSIALAQRNPVPAAIASGDNAAPAPDAGTGYQLTEHVKRYYATARI